MSVNLIRKNSDTPNIRNIDDARMLRYANSGRSGIIKDYAEEVALSQGASNTLHIGTGEIVHQGWQVEIASAGEDITLDNRDSVEYYTIYLEINLLIASNQTARILSMKANNTYPIIDPGDDLTQTPTGTSRVEIAHIYLVPSSSTFTITPLLEVMPYYPIYALEAGYASSDHSKGTIEQRLTDLGFKNGSLTPSGSGYSSLSISTNSLIKQGQMVKCEFECSLVEGSNLNITFAVPSGFKPINTQSLILEVVSDVIVRIDADVMDYGSVTEFITYNDVKIPLTVDISNTGNIVFDLTTFNTTLNSMYYKIFGSVAVHVRSHNIKGFIIYTGWQLNTRQS